MPAKSKARPTRDFCGAAATRPYRAWGYPVVPLVFVAMCLAVFLSIVVSQPLKSLAGLGLLLMAVPVYAVWKGRGAKNTGRP